ncbi:MAG: PilZ domain-containing protein [Spirochaetales bacterium]|nr:PilZ domain-containing protein [Spirochaetales bacterium]
MKALLVVDNDVVARLASFYLRPLGLDSIRYRDPLKALDNLEEIDPDAVVMSARDFPRHWKSIVVNVRTVRPKTECAIILLKGEFFPFEEAAKAAYLGVNGVVREDFSDRAELSRFQQILKRYVEVDEARVSDRHQPSEWDRLDFAFSHPLSLAPIAGRIETISTTGLSFIADYPALVADLETGAAIEDGSLRVDADILPCPCRLVRNGAVMAFKFEGWDAPSSAKLENYLKARTEREITGLLKK